jgi:hypothetical protein
MHLIRKCNCGDIADCISEQELPWRRGTVPTPSRGMLILHLDLLRARSHGQQKGIIYHAVGLSYLSSWPIADSLASYWLPLYKHIKLCLHHSFSQSLPVNFHLMKFFKCISKRIVETTGRVNNSSASPIEE